MDEISELFIEVTNQRLNRLELEAHDIKRIINRLENEERLEAEFQKAMGVAKRLEQEVQKYPEDETLYLKAQEACIDVGLALQALKELY